MLQTEYTWHSSITDTQADAIITLYNDVAKQESIIGYAEPLNQAEGDAVIRQLREDLARRNKVLLLINESNQSANSSFEVSKAEIGKVEVNCETHVTREIIGMALLSISGMPNCKHRAEISKGIIHSSYRHQGVLPLALLSIGHYAKSIGVSQLELDVRANTRSEQIWRKAGFIEYGRLPNYASPRNQPKEGVYMYQSTDSLIERFKTFKRK